MSLRHFSPLALALTLVSPFPASAAEKVVKTCRAVLEMPEMPKAEYNVSILKNGSSYSAEILQKVDGEESLIKESAAMLNGRVRSGLSAESDPSSLSFVEKLIVHAMMFKADPDLSKGLNLGFKLEDTRSVRAAVVGDATEDGSMSIVEAYNAKGKLLGSFLGGFFVKQCE